MKIQSRNVWLLLFWSILAPVALSPSAYAFPPAPHHLFYGAVRDEYGNPLSTAQAEVILETSAGVRLQTKVLPGLQPGVNYQLAVPMDAGITGDLYQPTALSPTVPFRIKVKIGNRILLPIEMIADYSRMGQPGERTRLNLTLGEDLDGDGLPDAWERALIAMGGGNKTLADINPGDDIDQDGMSNLDEYLSGNYAFDPKDGFALKVISAEADGVRLEFTAIQGRTYTIYGSRNLTDWSIVPFRIFGDGAAAAGDLHYSASETRVVQVTAKLNRDGEPFEFFKVMVQ